MRSTVILLLLCLTIIRWRDIWRFVRGWRSK